MAEYQHNPVLVGEVIEYLQLKQGGHYLDCTCGGGGHSWAILQARADVNLTLIDRDAEAIQASAQRLQVYGDRIRFWRGNFSEYVPDRAFDGILADLGVSSYQLDCPDRGFSFRSSGSLDMRMDQSQPLTAGHIVNQWQEQALADLIYQYGEERLSRRIARAIVRHRPLQTTTELAELIWQSVPPSYRYGSIHPATRTFQALRIAVNRELESLQAFLAKAPDWLQPKGRIAVISFHSLEDRMVKQAWRHDPRLLMVTKKPIAPSPAEAQQNPRARCAKLRVAEKISPDYA
ncbi:MAG: 16S rRNA (cytosine(1402)-N(4))-methyltransferase RsmH [Pseudanabaenaceae cyanobacterium]